MRPPIKAYKLPPFARFSNDLLIMYRRIFGQRE